MNGGKRNDKGAFGGDVRLPVAGEYVYPRRRRLMLWIGGAIAAALLLYALVDWLWRDAGFLSAGPLSSAHAAVETDCAACHQTTGRVVATVASERCGTCHEKLGDKLGVYSFASHYLYRSNDFQRVVATEGELACAECHPEHGGRQAAITAVPDARCRTCHEFASFGSGHPAFAVAAEPERAGLFFAHGDHLREVMRHRGLIDVERACLYCHNPEPDGRGFAPLDFDRHCDACHLTTGIATPRLPLAGGDGDGDGEGDGAPGVQSLAAIQARGGPGVEWAFYTNPNEFRQVGSRISKTPVHHRDPWILDNLRRLRQRLYPDAGLADLLVASPEVPPHQTVALYREAVATLRQHALGLRNRPEPEIQAELAAIDGVLRQLERRLDDPYVVLDETELALALESAAAPDPEIEGLVADLTGPCRTCHPVEKATIARVQSDQRQLRRAEFDHRAHILQARCLDCHVEIPIAENVADPTVGGTVDPELDRAEVQNLPSIDTCRTCHNPRLASDRCVTCHRFHPDQSRRSELLLYLDEGQGDG